MLIRREEYLNILISLKDKKIKAVTGVRRSLEKYYVVDIGFRFMLLGSKQMDAGHTLENLGIWNF